MGRKRYRKKDLTKSLYAYLLLFAVYLVYVVINYMMNNPITILLLIEIIALILLLRYYLKKYKTRKEKEKKKEFLRRYNTLISLYNKYKHHPTDFEYFVANIFDCLGYKTEVTKASNDGGKDIIMFKDNLKFVVEVKLYKETNAVSREKIQKLHSAMIDCLADKAIFVTTSRFTKTSIEYAKKHGIITIDGYKLVKLIDVASREEVPSDISIIFELS